MFQYKIGGGELQENSQMRLFFGLMFDEIEMRRAEGRDNRS
jgi:hypothetical protein